MEVVSNAHYKNVMTFNDNARPSVYLDLQRRFATNGRALTRSDRADDGRPCYIVTYFRQAHYFTNLHDLTAHLASILGDCHD